MEFMSGTSEHLVLKLAHMSLKPGKLESAGSSPDDR